MHITFGWYLDGVDWSHEQATLGAMACGPLGLLAWLESRLGLPMREISPAERISEYKAKILAADCEWCRQSFTLDPWACAQQLLAWRDELVAAGWQGTDGGSPRLEALQKIEQSGPQLSPGLADRLRHVLASKRRVVAELTIVDDPQTYPWLWRQLIKQFFPGYHCSSLDAPKELPEIKVIEGFDNTSLAVDLSRYLTSSKKEEKIALIAGGDTTFLDGILHRFGMPAVGRGGRSDCRDALQILPLWLANIWVPFNASHMMELLLLRHSPLSHVVGNAVIQCLHEAPGLDPQNWLSKGREALEKKGTYSAEEIGKILSFCQEMFTWERYREAEGIPQDILRQRLELLSKHLAPRVASAPEVGVALSHIKTLQRVIGSQSLWKRQELERVVEIIVGSGTGAPFAQREAMPFTVVSHPGQLRETYDTVIWWDFVDPNLSVATYWSQEERKKLSEEGCHWETELANQREALGWNRSLQAATHRLLVFVPATRNGEVVPHHPFYDELAHKLGDEAAVKAKRKSAQLLQPEGTWTLTDHTKQLKQVDPVVSAPRKQFQDIGPNDMGPQRISASQMNTFLSCPFRWFLEKQLYLKEPDMVTMPKDSIMVGTLAHKVVELLFQEKKDWEPEQAAQRARERFDELVPSMAADLLADSKNVERERVRALLGDSIQELIALIAKRHWTVIGTEMAREISWQGITLEGRCDLVLKDDQGKEVVIDLKWSSSNHYQELVSQDKSLQLATYAKLLDDVHLKVPSGYYLLPLKRYIANNQNDAQVWKKIEDTYKTRLEELQKGKLWYGIDPEDYRENSEERQAAVTEQNLAIDVIPCGFCCWKHLCGKMADVHVEED